ncbi:MAG: ABC transporter permease [Puniceicoccales bacterium]|jgi:oligopeptide transport system permease protein|nr:ABC transporter permease [Puniceicoccales bacterium]
MAIGKKNFRWQWLWLALVCCACSLAMVLPDHAALVQDIDHCLDLPSRIHWLGTDLLGRDLLLRLFFGAKVSLAVGLGSTVLAVAVGTAVGATAGYFGGSFERMAMRLMDVLYVLPLTLLASLICLFLGRGIGTLCLAIASVEWLTLARVVRTKTADLRRRTFVQSAIALGRSHGAVICCHIVPNAAPLIGRYALIILPNAILLEAFLSFLGLGVPPPRSSWGNMIVEAIPYMHGHPLPLLFPALCLSTTLLAFTTLRGDGAVP